MAVNKVEYIKDSSTAGFAIAGEQKPINKQTAPTIEKDVEEKNTQDLTGGQKNYLNNALQGSDNTSYETTDGENINSEDADSNYDNGGPGVKEGLTTMGTMGAAGAVGGLAVAMGAELELAFASAQVTAVESAKPIMNSYSAPVIGGIDLALAAAATVGVAMFDSNYSQRLAENNAVGEYISSIDEYIQNMDMDIDAFLSQIEATEEPEPTSTGDDDTAKTLEDLQAQLQAAIDAGDEETANEIREQIETLQNSEGTTTGENAELTPDIVIARNSEAHALNDFSTDVAFFLGEGNNYGKFGAINTTALALCTTGSTLLSILAWKGVNLINIPMATAGAAMCTAASATFLAATGLMGIKTANEYKCGSGGQNLDNKLSELNTRFGEHDNIVQMLGAEQETPEEPSVELPDSGTPEPSPTTDNNTESPTAGTPVTA